MSTDPFTNPDSQHATEVEPDTFASGQTVLATFQVGRFFNGGASDIGWARSTDGGATWGVSSFLPGLTSNAGPFSNHAMLRAGVPFAIACAVSISSRKTEPGA